MRQTSFELVDSSAAAVTPDLFGIWSTQEAAPAAVAFDGSATAQPEPVIWRSWLPPDPAQAERELARAEALQQQRDAAFHAALPRMQALLSAEVQVSFALPDLAAAERDLLQAVSEAQNPAASSFAPGTAGFDWAAANQRLRQFMQRSLRSIVYAAWVETRIGAQLRGRSIVGWGGDTHTVWDQDVIAGELQLHRRSVDLALGSRLALIRSFGLAGRGAAIVATAVSSPIGPVMALPAAWRFVNELSIAKTNGRDAAAAAVESASE